MTTNNLYNAPKSDLTSTRRTSPNQSKIFTTIGRIGRLRYLAYTMVCYLALSVAKVTHEILQKNKVNSDIESVLFELAWIPFLISIAFLVVFAKRRFNDLNKPSWYCLLVLAPLVNIIVILMLSFSAGENVENQYGPPPSANPLSVTIAGLVMAIATILGLLTTVILPTFYYVILKITSLS